MSPCTSPPRAVLSATLESENRPFSRSSCSRRGHAANELVCLLSQQQGTAHHVKNRKQHLRDVSNILWGNLPNTCSQLALCVLEESEYKFVAPAPVQNMKVHVLKRGARTLGQGTPSSSSSVLPTTFWCRFFSATFLRMSKLKGQPNDERRRP